MLSINDGLDYFVVPPRNDVIAMTRYEEEAISPINTGLTLPWL